MVLADHVGGGSKKGGRKGVSLGGLVQSLHHGGALAPQPLDLGLQGWTNLQLIAGDIKAQLNNASLQGGNASEVLAVALPHGRQRLLRIEAVDLTAKIKGGHNLPRLDRIRKPVFRSIQPFLQRRVLPGKALSAQAPQEQHNSGGDIAGLKLVDRGVDAVHKAKDLPAQFFDDAEVHRVGGWVVKKEAGVRDRDGNHRIAARESVLAHAAIIPPINGAVSTP